jgi:hypothetical protein
MISPKTHLSPLLEAIKYRLETNSELALVFEDVVDFCVYGSKRGHTSEFDSELAKFKAIKWGQSEKDELKQFIKDTLFGTQNPYTKVTMLLVLSKFEGEKEISILRSVLKEEYKKTMGHYKLLSQALIALNNAGEDLITDNSFDIFEIEKHIVAPPIRGLCDPSSCFSTARNTR